jgi:hypothetical protein
MPCLCLGLYKAWSLQGKTRQDGDATREDQRRQKQRLTETDIDITRQDNDKIPRFNALLLSLSSVDKWTRISCVSVCLSVSTTCVFCLSMVVRHCLSLFIYACLSLSADLFLSLSSWGRSISVSACVCSSGFSHIKTDPHTRAPVLPYLVRFLLGLIHTLAKVLST